MRVAVLVLGMLLTEGALGKTASAPLTEEQLQRRATDSAFVLRRLGSGLVPDLASGRTLRLPIQQRVHVVIAAEGYTREDLQTGAFERELERWEREIFSVEPYASFREAFVIWALPLPSAQRLTPGRPEPRDTALRLPVTPDGWGVGRVTPTGPTAARLWAHLAEFPVPLTFFPQGGRLDRLARNLVAVISLYDPRTREGGFSGKAVNLSDPAAPERRVATAIGIDRPHEFSHAFARLTDEYLDDALGSLGVDNGRTRTSLFIANVVESARCDTLPWRHLLPGGEFNPDTHDLVGAFGAPGRGYHPELKCLMNGRHDNARYYGGNGILRTMDRLCNFCRELATMRLHERIGVLDQPLTSLDTWSTRYRRPFYERFGFQVPATVPQMNNAGQPFYQACTP